MAISVLAREKLVLLGRYIWDYYVGIVQQVLPKKTWHAKNYCTSQLTSFGGKKTFTSLVSFGCGAKVKSYSFKNLDFLIFTFWDLILIPAYDKFSEVIFLILLKALVSSPKYFVSNYYYMNSAVIFSDVAFHISFKALVFFLLSVWCKPMWVTK